MEGGGWGKKGPAIGDHDEERGKKTSWSFKGNAKHSFIVASDREDPQNQERQGLRRR